MRPRRNAMLAVVAWVLVVVVGSSLVWAVISRAGRGVAGDDPLPAAERSTATPTARSSPATPSPTRSSPTRSPGGTTSPSSPGGQPDGQPDAPVRRTWQGAAGVVSATCRGPAIRLAGASANSGYAVEVDDSGPDRVRVEFEGGDGSGKGDGGGRRTRVEAVCSAGVPVFTEDD